MKYSPGPWQIKRNTPLHSMPFQIVGKFNPNTGHCGHVCNVFVHEDKRDNTELANARLIVVAPEMLEMLQSLIKDCIEMAEAEFGDETTGETETIRAYPKTIKRIRELIAKATK